VKYELGKRVYAL